MLDWLQKRTDQTPSGIYGIVHTTASYTFDLVTHFLIDALVFASPIIEGTFRFPPSNHLSLNQTFFIDPPPHITEFFKG